MTAFIPFDANTRSAVDCASAGGATSATPASAASATAMNSAKTKRLRASAMWRAMATILIRDRLRRLREIDSTAARPVLREHRGDRLRNLALVEPVGIL